MTWAYVAGALTATFFVGALARWWAGAQHRERERLEALVAARTGELRASEAKFRGIFENAVEGIFQSSLEGRNLDANPAMARICGFASPEEQRAATTDVETQFYVQPGRRREINARLAREGGVLVGCESEIYRRDGSTIWVSENVRLVCDPTTGQETYLGSIVDVTAKRQAEATLRALQRRLALFVQEMPLALVECDLAARVTAWNPAAERIFGYPAAEAVGRAVSDLLLAEDERGLFLAGWSRFAARPGHQATIRQVRTRDGRVIACECYCTPLADEDGTVVGVASLGLDVTERERAQEQLRAATAAAEAANRAKSAFLANMSHELRTPLNVILSFVRVMRRDPATEGRFRERLAIVEASGEQLLHLINEVLDLSKIEAGKMELSPGPCSLAALLMGLSDVFAPRAAERGVAFTCELDPATLPALVRADELRLRQVLTNLLDNAFKFTERGAVGVRVTRADGNVLTFEVRDTGVGIPPEQQAAIFQPFHQMDAHRHGPAGTGLGLSISRRLVGLMGGELRVESSPGQGSRFFFALDLPPAALPLGAQRAPRPRITGSLGPPRHVLVVDDEPAGRAATRELLEQVGLRVSEAAGGRECLAVVAGLRPDLVLLDLRMAPPDGLETARQLRQNGISPETRILAFSAGTPSPAEQARIAADCDGFVPKPLDVDQLCDQIADLLGLAWTYDEPAAPPTPPAAPVPGPQLSPARPPRDEVAALLALARQGDVIKLRARLRQPGNQDGAHAAFAREIDALAARFQLARIVQTLQAALVPGEEHP